MSLGLTWHFVNFILSSTFLRQIIGSLSPIVWPLNFFRGLMKLVASSKPQWSTRQVRLQSLKIRLSYATQFAIIVSRQVLQSSWAACWEVSSHHSYSSGLWVPFSGISRAFSMALLSHLQKYPLCPVTLYLHWNFSQCFYSWYNGFYNLTFFSQSPLAYSQSHKLLGAQGYCSA